MSGVESRLEAASSSPSLTVDVKRRGSIGLTLEKLKHLPRTLSFTWARTRDSLSRRIAVIVSPPPPSPKEEKTGRASHLRREIILFDVKLGNRNIGLTSKFRLESCNLAVNSRFPFTVCVHHPRYRPLSLSLFGPKGKINIPVEPVFRNTNQSR